VVTVVCAVRVIAESDLMQDFLSSSEDNVVSFCHSRLRDLILGIVFIMRYCCLLLLLTQVWYLWC